MKSTDPYIRQKNHAKKRGIEFKLTKQEWLDFWGEDLNKRGRGAGKLQMCRVGDKGCYEIGNIYKQTHEHNSKDKFNNGFMGKPRAINIEIGEMVSNLLKMNLSTRAVAFLVNCSQKQVMNFKNQKGAYV